MNIKKIISIFLLSVGVSLFIGFMISTAGAAMYPPLNKIAAPFVCSGGTMQVVEQTYHPAPGETVTTQTWSCVDGATGQSRQLGTLVLAAFVIPLYAIIVFFPILILVALQQLILAPRSQARQQHATTDAALSRFKAMQASGRISQAQYDLMARTLNENKSSPVKAEIQAIREAFNAQGGANEAANSSESQLKKLKELLEQGLITQQDYDEKKADILKRM